MSKQTILLNPSIEDMEQLAVWPYLPARKGDTVITAVIVDYTEDLPAEWFYRQLSASPLCQILVVSSQPIDRWITLRYLPLSTPKFMLAKWVAGHVSSIHHCSRKELSDIKSIMSSSCW
jgi:hypothetical protein